MNMEEYLRALENHVASHKLNLGDGESVLSLLYEAYGDINPMYDDQIKADFAELYQALNGMPLREMDWIIDPVCALCRDHERNGFVHGVQVGVRLAQEIQNVESSIYAMPQPGEMELRLLLLLERRHFSTEPSQSGGICCCYIARKVFP